MTHSPFFYLAVGVCFGVTLAHFSKPVPIKCVGGLEPNREVVTEEYRGQ